MDHCSTCNLPGFFSKCGKCKAVVYCSKECQIQAWPLHRLACGPDKLSPETPSISILKPSSDAQVPAVELLCSKIPLISHCPQGMIASSDDLGAEGLFTHGVAACVGVVMVLGNRACMMHVDSRVAALQEMLNEDVQQAYDALLGAPGEEQLPHLMLVGGWWPHESTVVPAVLTAVEPLAWASKHVSHLGLREPGQRVGGRHRYSLVVGKVGQVVYGLGWEEWPPARLRPVMPLLLNVRSPSNEEVAAYDPPRLEGMSEIEYWQTRIRRLTRAEYDVAQK